LEKSGTDEIESKIFSFLFDADGDGKISFEEVLQSTGFMETDGKYLNLKNLNSRMVEKLTFTM